MGVEEIYNIEMQKPLQILDIFNEFFGEDRVDMQGFPTLSEVESAFPKGTSAAARIKEFIHSNTGNPFILVHFPQVTVTNENDRSTNIRHLYAKVSFGIDGKMNGRFALNRAEYTMLHISNDYMHSHVSSIPFGNFENFQTPCTGSGPINNTICSLARDFDADLWRLFCLELDRFVHVESIAGTPYHRLEGLVQGGRSVAMRINDNIRGSQRLDTLCLGNTSTPLIEKPQLALFVKYLIDKEVLKFNFVGGEFNVAMSNTEAIIKVSNCFIEWYNKMFERGQVTATMNELIASSIIVPCKYTNGYLVRPMTGNGHYSSTYNAYVGQRICTFKGRDVTLSISDLITTTPEENQVIILRPLIINYIITKILNVINFRYGNKRDDQEGSSHKKVYFV